MNMENKIMDYKDHFTPIGKTNYDINQIIDSYKNYFTSNDKFLIRASFLAI